MGCREKMFYCLCQCMLIHLVLYLCIVDKYSSQFGGTTNQYAYYHEEDESSFQLVDTARIQKPPYQRGRNRFTQVCLAGIPHCFLAFHIVFWHSTLFSGIPHCFLAFNKALSYRIMLQKNGRTLKVSSSN